MTFSTILGVTETLCSFRLGLEGKDARIIKIRVLRKVISKQSCFIRCRRQHLWANENRNYIRFTFENIISNSPKVRRAKVLASDVFFCFSSIFKFGSFKNPFAKITSLSEFYFRFKRFTLLIQTKKWFLWSMTGAQAAENHGDMWGLTWYLWWGVYASIPTWTHLQNSLAAAEALSLKISSHGTSLKWSWRLPQSAQK